MIVEAMLMVILANGCATLRNRSDDLLFTMARLVQAVGQVPSFGNRQGSLGPGLCLLPKAPS